MDLSWITELDQSWIIAGGAGAVVLFALVWFLVRRRSKRDDGSETNPVPGEEIRLTEPTLEPLPEVSGSTDPEAPESETTGEPADEAPETQPVPAQAAESEPVPEPEPVEAAEAPEQADRAEAPPISDPAFLAAREAFERQLLAGNFSRLDVFDAYARAQEGPDAPSVPRSEFFHRVVNQALEIRDAFEALLQDEDRDRFVDIHSRYLDDVTEEADAGVRERLHREHQDKLGSLRPKAAEHA